MKQNDVSKNIPALSPRLMLTSCSSLPRTDVFLVFSPAGGTDESLKVYQKPGHRDKPVISSLPFLLLRGLQVAVNSASRCCVAVFQTCMGKDVTLHVSASNPAMLLYQKFGFKAEEYILDFYDKYYPVDSTECRHAFFLRLRR